MAIFGQISEEEIRAKYTHYGVFAGLCPVYLADLSGASVTLAERNWIPGWWLVFSAELFGAFIFLRNFLDPDWEPMFPIAVTGEIK